MNPPQNQNNQPDYGFIVNQPTVPQKKKMDVRMKVVIGLVIALVVLIPTILITGRISNFVPQNMNNKYVDLTKSYLGEIDAQNYEAAYTYFDDSIGGNRETFVKIFAPLFHEGSNTAECSVSAAENNTSAVQVSCSDRDNTIDTTYMFSYSDETSKITEVKTVRQEPKA